MKFIADCMLGKLAKWLRLLGFDTAYLRDAEDSELMRIALQEDRILLTRDGPLAKHKMVRDRSVFIESEKTSEQLRQVIDTLGISVDREKLFTRCIVCNGPIEDVPKEWVKDKVPPYVYQTQDQFGYCRSCDKICWRGTHVDHIIAALDGA